MVNKSLISAIKDWENKWNNKIKPFPGSASMSNDTTIQTLKEKINKLNEEAWNIRVKDSPKAFLISKEALDLARSIQYEKGMADGARSLGFCYGRLSKHEEAISLFNESLRLYESLNDIDGQSNVIEYLGFTSRNQGDLGAALKFLYRSLLLAEQTGFPENRATSHYQLGVTYKHLGDYEKALEHLYQSLSIMREMNNTLYQSYSINVIGSIYFDNGDYEHALEYYQQGYVSRHEAGDKWGEAGSLDNIGFTYFKLKDYDQAIHYCDQSLTISRSTDDKRSQANALIHLAEIYSQTNNAKLAARFSNESLEIRKESGDKRGEAEILLFLADLHKTQNEDGARVLELLTNALKIAEDLKALDLLSKARFSLYEFYQKQNDYEEALKNLNLHNNVEKEFHKNTINQKVLNLEISHKAEESRKEADAMKLRNEELTKLNAAIEEQKKKLEAALAELKATQAQLIQSEKMASLGELTAGIAHEIQNPLNFVNNFSEVNEELLKELNAEADKGNLEEVKAIAKDITFNSEKINHHGRRADAIVKGMLQHSRSSSGQKEPTDINALADEYLRLAYHGLRAKDKSFNATMKTDFDETIGNINIIPQEIGRVILNLINNAFYAAHLPPPVGGGFKDLNYKHDPTVWVSTKKVGDKVLISVRDNGPGIPQKILDKIFQPFFTTKPTGQGTGLGLSLSYDIVKAHGGELKVETKEGEGSEFIIHLST
ncbi:MAG TPA: tetratricopeptide repeat protein [Chitinophagaceae bacterium]